MSSDSVDAAAGEVDRCRAPVPKLRFPKFRDAGEWKSERLGELIRTITPPKKLPTSQYAASGDYPIVDQSQDLVCGWTNDKDAVVNQGGSTIVFGDHTCTLKLVSFPFAQGADGLKILTAKSGIVIGFLYQSLLHNPLEMEDYRRHFSILKDRIVRFPDIESGEQQKIADCLSSLDAVIATEGERLAELGEHKKGLLQALFPAEGQTTPRLRFPEFRDAGEWDSRTLAEVTDMRAGKFIPASNISGTREEGSFPCFGGNGLRGYTSTYTHTGKYPLVGRQGALCGNVNLASGSFYATEHAVVAKARDGISVDWLYHLLIRLDLNRFKTGQAQPGLSVEVLNRLPCLVPSEIEEQQRIADCLFWLDELIVFGVQRLATLKTYKSGLMQRLFPASIEAIA